jgi:NAD(P)-dependent dehydrogenase (short-subunit alcohol dehydrogenase family)
MPSVLVTGASRGIGNAIAEHLASRGWDVIAGVRSQQDAETVTKLNPQRISSVILDVTSADDIAALEGSLPERLDAVVNNAGIAVGGAMETLSPDEWRKQLEINVIGQLAVTTAVLPRPRRVHLQYQRSSRDAAFRRLRGEQVRVGGRRGRLANGTESLANSRRRRRTREYRHRPVAHR